MREVLSWGEMLLFMKSRMEEGGPRFWALF